MSIVTVHVTSTISQATSERRFDKATTISALKCKLELISGASAATMVLQLYDPHDKLVCVMENGDAMLGSFPVEDYFRIHVVETNPLRKVGEFEDTSKVEKYEMDDEDYAKRQDSVLAYKQRNKLGRFADDAEAKEQAIDDEGKEAALKISVGERCVLKKSDGSIDSTRRGSIQFVGKTKFARGYWVGVGLDEPLGKHDGTVQGARYFTCAKSCGVMVRPSGVDVGDYPEIDPFGSDDEM